MPRRTSKTKQSNQLAISDPSIQEKRDAEREIVILFADVVGCSEVSNHKSLKDYNHFVNTFHKCFEDVCNYYKENYYKDRGDFFDFEPRGDEGCLKIFAPESDIAEDIDIALNIALDLKRIWLLEEENQTRINDGLLPIDIGIGIHSGKAWLNKKKNGKYRPEGYVINLAKRIESASREGEFSHILISEASYNQLNLLKDEYTYRFREPFRIDPKGVSTIKVFELKHHFLPTEWANKPKEVSLIYSTLKDADVEIVEKAYACNPMNLWLAEEYILLSIMNITKKLTGKETQKELEEKYKHITEVTQRVANSDLRDAGILSLWGFVYGEQENFIEEQLIYKEGIEMDKLDGLLHWYLALSISYGLMNKMQNEGIDVSKDIEKINKDEVKKFYKNNLKKIEDTFKEFKRALDLEPMNPWIIYDFACEKSWWSLAFEDDKKNEYRKIAKDNIIKAIGFNETIKEWALKEDYVKPIMNDVQVNKILNS